MTEFHVPSEAEPVQDPTKVRRSKDGRPYVKQLCPDRQQIHSGTGTVFGGECIDGRVRGKISGKTKQCPTCKGRGYVEKLYTRCTSFVSVMEERTQLERWKLRTVLVGVAIDHVLMQALMASDPDDQAGLNQIADQAFELGDGALKARKGTDLHKLTEYVDRGQPLPKELTDPDTGQTRPVTLQDRADMAAWKRVVEDRMTFIDSERFVVNDEYQIGGTYDRLVDIETDHPCDKCDLPMILDLKTGRVDYGQGKIAQQEAVYANSDNYDPATGERTPQDVCRHRGLIVHLPQGTGEATVLVADLEEGWERVKLSSKVREHRRTERALLSPLG